MLVNLSTQAIELQHTTRQTWGGIHMEIGPPRVHSKDFVDGMKILTEQAYHTL
ncbi:hypothetical protein DPMN_073329 [Dreissena polymorpha]|uniref:Uncharacterized protein n=1 Tax=Dreissena polymorpha TaxID=45954 RepID=A0A9D4BYU4_DREPO|nr:hypothetical protein DPMN_073329 [Dreissena polymorpha]